MENQFTISEACEIIRKNRNKWSSNELSDFLEKYKNPDGSIPMVLRWSTEKLGQCFTTEKIVNKE